MNRTRGLAGIVAVLLLAAASCGRSDSESESTTTVTAAPGETVTTTVPAPGEGEGTALADGGFGDLANVCGPGDASGATDLGVTDTEIRVGTLTDKGAQIRPGLTKEMYDAALAFTSWCNEKGGILGRELVLDDLDAALFNYGSVITTACTQDFALVGGGAVFDDADNGERVNCGLANVAAYLVTPKARVADLQVQPVPNPVYSFAVGGHKAADRMTDGGLAAFGVMTGALVTTQIVRDATVEAIGILGGTTVSSADYAPQGETNWTPFVEDLRSKGVKIFEFIGEPQNLQALQTTMATAGYAPDITLLQTNFYDSKYIEEGGSNAINTWVRTGYYPFELAADNKATQDFLDLMEQYNPDGKVATLGAQAISAYLLFAQAAAECGSDLTRACMLENAKVDEWTGGGLHAATSPAANTPSPCFALLRVTPDGFVLDEENTQATDGIFNCDDGNLIALENDYGVPR